MGAFHPALPRLVAGVAVGSCKLAALACRPAACTATQREPRALHSENGNVSRSGCGNRRIVSERRSARAMDQLPHAWRPARRRRQAQPLRAVRVIYRMAHSSERNCRLFLGEEGCPKLLLVSRADTKISGEQWSWTP
jgi:hypothetical protein